ncbi:oxidoreductase [Pedobacter sp. HMF7647]|uniref:Oxidoreductase n=1 Tax=Hufsiella arboris TaxID=2695275 RepID=A0A7K1YBY1_9SPHI|nr:NADH:flavin oxidoreductase/NADH oxidase [Hufsiella arboris]MXV52075.1 oxidoreductase [Hufsiella arboris]
MSKLFETIKFKDLILKNRIGISPMCMYSSKDGFANNFHVVHLGSRAIGGAGLIIQEATAVSPEGRITASDMGLWKDEHIEKLSEITSFVKSHYSVIGIQLAHAGRKASHQTPWNGGKQISTSNGGWKTVSSTETPFHEGTEPSEELDLQGIRKILDDFKAAAGRALTAGYQLIEIHAAHGYLVHQFLSPLVNQRKDQYGESFENRIRLILEIVDSVKEAWPDNYPLFVRISATDWAEGGWDLEQSIKLASILKEKGVDLIDCSSGGAVHWQKIDLKPGYQVPFAEKIKKESGIRTAAVGLITNAEQAEKIISSEQADIVLFARESLRDAYFPIHAAKKLNNDIIWPVQYERAKLK